MKLIIHTDGGARGNPGPSGIGVVIADADGKPLETASQFIGEGTNNRAEYAAVLHALTRAQALGGTELEFYLDSELVVRQLSGKYKIKHPDLAAQAGEVLKRLRSFSAVHFHHVPREKNALADRLVNRAIDEATGLG